MTDVLALAGFTVVLVVAAIKFSIYLLETRGDR